MLLTRREITVVRRGSVRICSIKRTSVPLWSCGFSNSFHHCIPAEPVTFDRYGGLCFVVKLSGN